ncbi:uncharacterized protein LOC125369819 [Ricinus communis]|uniref:uncharacterized protein LOC125369819 n=1 Tax=Ricinus communis TaxID=3988 RepID=UPI00201A2B05|nr:uncharacterized protein LOC125369819 [Ricinus communis]
MVDAAAGGALNSKTFEQAHNLIKEMAMKNYQWQSSRSQPVRQDKLARKEPEPETMGEEKVEDRQKSPMKEYQPPVPYPARLKQEKVDKQFGKFLDLFKQLQINLPFVEAILQMLKYAKFLKESLSNKRKLEDLGLVTLNEKCSTILQNKLPLKRRDPGSFTVPCIIGDLPISGALADLGANVLVKVDKFIFLVDFSVMDMKDESTVPLILGRPFLATPRAVIDVCDGKLQLRVDDETITFDLATTTRHSLDHDDVVFSIDILDYLVESHLHEILLDDPLQVALQGEEEELSNKQVLEQLASLLATEPSCSTNPFLSLDRSEVQKVNSSFEDPPALELKELPKHLSYGFLDEEEKLSVIIASDLTPEERAKALDAIKRYKKAFAYKIADIPGINPSFCSHKILMEDSYRAVVQPQRQLNLNMKEVVKKEEFDIKIRDKKGAENLAADQLSRLENPSLEALNESMIDDQFPEEHLYSLKRSDNISTRDEMPQTSMQTVEILDVWGIDFMGPFASSNGNKYILVAIEYFSKCLKAQAFPIDDARVICRFLKRLFARFGTPRALIIDRGTHLCNAQLKKALRRYGVTHRFSTPYHP